MASQSKRVKWSFKNSATEASSSCLASRRLNAVQCAKCAKARAQVVVRPAASLPRSSSAKQAVKQAVKFEANGPLSNQARASGFSAQIGSMVISSCETTTRALKHGLGPALRDLQGQITSTFAAVRPMPVPNCS